MPACWTWTDWRRIKRLRCRSELEPTSGEEMGNTATKFRKALINGDELLACHLYESNQQFKEALDPNATYGESYQHNTPLHYAARHAMIRLLRSGCGSDKIKQTRKQADRMYTLRVAYFWIVCCRWGKNGYPRVGRWETNVLCYSFLICSSWLINWIIIHWFIDVLMELSQISNVLWALFLFFFSTVTNQLVLFRAILLLRMRKMFMFCLYTSHLSLHIAIC